jgi:hypothetical protein
VKQNFAESTVLIDSPTSSENNLSQAKPTMAAFTFSVSMQIQLLFHDDSASLKPKMYVCLYLLHFIVIPDIITGLIGLIAGGRQMCRQ